MIFFIQYLCLIVIGIGLYNLIEQLPKEEAEGDQENQYKILKVTSGLGLVLIPGGCLIFLLNL